MAFSFEFFVSHPAWAAGLLFLSLVSPMLWLFRCNQRSSSFPPGPPTLPVLGNLHQMPYGFPFLKFTEWRKSYGDIIGLKVGSLNMIILSSPELVHSLFINRGSIYSGRNVPFLVRSFLFPGQEQPIMFQNDAKLRRMRTALKHLTGAPGLVEALPMQDRISSNLVSQLRQKTYPAEKCIGLWSFEIANTAIMGPVGSEEGMPELLDRWLVLQHALLDALASSTASAYDVLPLLRYLRPVMPGAAEAKARAIGAGLHEIYVDFFARLRHHLRRAEDTGEKIEYLGLVGKIMESQRQRPESKGRASESEPDSYTEPQLRSMVQFVQDAATDTTTSTVMSCILGLALHPEILSRAQAEVDLNCSRNAEDMPTHSDIGRLPYVKACIWEALRWRSPAPLLLPHRAERDDTIHGYHIPKDSIVMGNAWAMSRDESIFKDPETFDPERFMPGKAVPPFHPFGVGRRSCPGDQFAMNSMMVALPKLLRSFDFVLDGPRPDLSIENAFSAGVVMSPKVFPVEFVPRDA